jgi:hypothetical protein
MRRSNAIFQPPSATPRKILRKILTVVLLASINNKGCPTLLQYRVYLYTGRIHLLCSWENDEGDLSCREFGRRSLPHSRPLESSSHFHHEQVGVREPSLASDHRFFHDTFMLFVWRQHGHVVPSWTHAVLCTHIHTYTHGSHLPPRHTKVSNDLLVASDMKGIPLDWMIHSFKVQLCLYPKHHHVAKRWEQLCRRTCDSISLFLKGASGLSLPLLLLTLCQRCSIQAWGHSLQET